MSIPLRILLVEDSDEDAELIRLHLRERGLVCTCVQEDSLAGFRRALDSDPYDLVLSDFSLPGTDGLELLRFLRRRDPDLPFILLSGTLDENAAVEAMRLGANDFILKGNLSRLVPAIERELRDHQVRLRRRADAEALGLLHTAMTQTPDMVIITNSEGKIVYVNPAAEVCSGYSKEDLLGENPRIFKSGRHDQAFYGSMWNCLLSGETWRGQVINRRKDGSLWESEAVISPVFGADGELQSYLCTARDVTHEHELQTMLEQSQRLETIGVLTSGIAHDFNNILMPVVGHAELGLGRLPGDPKIHHDLEIILASAKRAADLIRQILSFSRKGDQELSPVDLRLLMRESFKLLRATVPTPITFQLDLEAEGCFVLGDPTKLHQVILNLGTNAAFAMRGTAGRLAMRLQKLSLPETACAMGISLAPGDYVCIEVEDTGRGIAPEHMDKIFLPFFSTKAPKEGTGLGLSMIHGIVSALGGGIQVQSTLGEGTVFRILLPPVTAKVEAPEPDEVLLTGQGRLLVVDDEMNVLYGLEGGLKSRGFDVQAFQDPCQALEAFSRDPEAFDLLLTDQMMPILTGLRLAERIWSIRPGLPAILLTGNPDLMDIPGELASRFRVILAKPVQVNNLARTILNHLPPGSSAPLRT